jgi:hypothetical protein
MKNETFLKMPPAQRVQVLRTLAEGVFDRSFVDEHWRMMEPILRNMVGHGESVGPGIPGHTADPGDNYWKGEWQIYEAD